MPLSRDESGNVDYSFVSLTQGLVAPEVFEVYWRVNNSDFFKVAFLPVLLNRFFSVVAVTEDHIQLADPLLYPPFEQPQVNFSLKFRVGVVIMYLRKVDVCDVFFGFV